MFFFKRNKRTNQILLSLHEKTKQPLNKLDKMYRADIHFWIEGSEYNNQSIEALIQRKIVDYLMA